MKDRVAGGAGRPPFGFAFRRRKLFNLLYTCAPLRPPRIAAPRPRAPSPESRPLSPLSHPHTSSRGGGVRCQPKEVLPRGLSRDVHPASGMLSSRARGSRSLSLRGLQNYGGGVSYTRARRPSPETGGGPEPVPETINVSRLFQSDNHVFMLASGAGGSRHVPPGPRL